MSVDSDAVVSDAELITAVRAGDSAPFADLYERHEAAALAVARQYSNSAQDAEDATSEAFARVLAAIQGGGGPDVAFRAYLFTVVRRVALARIESARRVSPTPDDAAFDAIVEPVESTEAPAMAGLERGLVARAYRSLPERWQAVLWYTEVEGMTPAQVGPALGLTANGVAALSYRAREGLRQAYLQQHLAEPASEACTIVNTKLGSYVRGGLAKRETALVESHLDECGGCRALVLELGDVNHGMRTVIGPLVLGVAMTALAGVGLGGSAAAGAAAGVAGGAGSTATGSASTGSAATGSAATGSGAVTAGSTAASVTVPVGSVAASGAVVVGAGSVAGATSAMAATAATSAVAGTAAGGLAALLAAMPIGLVAAAAAGVVGLAALGVGGALGMFSPDAPAATVRAEVAEVAEVGSQPFSPEATLSPEPSPSPAPSPEPVTDVSDPAADPVGPETPAPGPTTPDATTTPTAGPTTAPPTTDPTSGPTTDPTSGPTVDPTPDPTSDPTPDPTSDPTVDPTPDPTPDPTADPTPDPTPDPTDDPTVPPAPPGVLLGGFTPDGLSFAAGTASRLDLEVSNPGGTASGEVLVELVVPDGVTAIITPVEVGDLPAPGAVARAQSAPWACDGLVCALPGLAPSETRTLALDVTLEAPGIDGTADVEVGLRAWLPVAGEAPAPQTYLVPYTSAPAVLQVVAPAEQAFDFDTPGTLTYSVTNTGGTTARGLTATVVLPADVAWIDPAAVPVGSGWTCDATTERATCTLASLAPAQTADLTLGVAVTTLAGEVRFEVATDGIAPPAVSTRVHEVRAELELQGHDTKGVLFVFGAFKYTVSNAATATAATEGLSVEVTLPEGVTLLWASSGWAKEGDGRHLTFSHGPLAAGVPADLTLTVIDFSRGTSESSATVRATNARPVGPAYAHLAV